MVLTNWIAGLFKLSYLKNELGNEIDFFCMWLDLNATNLSGVQMGVVRPTCTYPKSLKIMNERNHEFIIS